MDLCAWIEPKVKAGSVSTADRAGKTYARILKSAYRVFMTHGYSDASTLEIATRAQVSKRDLYRLVGNKRDLLHACITARARRMQMPGGAGIFKAAADIRTALIIFGTKLLEEASDPAVLAMHRLAIQEAHAPMIRQELSEARKATRAVLERMMREAVAKGLLADVSPKLISNHFLSLLWDDLLVRLLLRLTERPSRAEVKQRAARAADFTLVIFGKQNAVRGKNAVS